MKTDFSFETDAVMRFIKSLWPQTAALELRGLQALERNVLGGMLFTSAPRFVMLVGQALCRNPAICRGISGPALLRRQVRASALRGLRHSLILLLELVSDTYLYEQAGAIADARSAVDEFNRHLPDLGPGEALDQLSDLDPALAILEKAGEARHEVWKRIKAERGQSVDGRRRTQAESERDRLEVERIWAILREAVRRGLGG